MRIVFIGTGEIGVPALRALLDSEHEVVALITQPDKRVGREQRIEPPPIKKEITRSGGFQTPKAFGAGKSPLLEVLQPAKIKDPQTIEEIGDFAPDVIVVVAYGQINWSESAEAIERKIRAYNPWPGVFMKVDRQNLKVFSASVVDLHGQPGEVLRSDKDLIVATGKGALSLAEVQLEGKRRMSAAEFLRGHGALVRGAR